MRVVSSVTEFASTAKPRLLPPLRISSSFAAALDGETSRPEHLGPKEGVLPGRLIVRRAR